MAADPVTQDDLIAINDSLKVITDFLEDSQKSLVIEDPDFVDPTPDTPITEHDLSLYHEMQFYESFNTATEDIQKSLTDLNKSVSEIDDSSSNMSLSIESIDEEFLPVLEMLSENQNQIIENQTTIIENQNKTLEVQNLSSGTVLSYGVYYIPFAIIVFLLWRFFSTFLRTYR